MIATADDLRPGTPVLCPGGRGHVGYVRMAPPTFSHVYCVSVVLDERRDAPGYSGTIYHVDDVSKLDEVNP